MKRAYLVLLAVLFTIVAAGFTKDAGAEDIKIGYVDVASVFDSYEKTKDQDSVLAEKSEKEKSRRDKMVEKITNMKNELDLLNDKQKQKKQEAIEEEMIALRDFDKEAKDGLKKERDNILRDILKEIDATITEYAQANSYGVIFNSRVLVYGEQKYDITNEITNILNSKYRKKK